MAKSVASFATWVVARFCQIAAARRHDQAYAAFIGILLGGLVLLLLAVDAAGRYLSGMAVGWLIFMAGIALSVGVGWVAASKTMAWAKTREPASPLPRAQVRGTPYVPPTPRRRGAYLLAGLSGLVLGSIMFITVTMFIVMGALMVTK